MISILKISKGNNSAKRYNFNTNHIERVTVHNQSLVILYLYQVSWNDLKPYQSYRQDTISMPEIKMGNNSANNVSGVTTFNLCKMAGHALYCTKFCEIISNSIKVIEQTPFLYSKLQRGIIPQKNVGGATVVNLCMSSGHALYLCQVSWNNIKRYQSYRVSTISIRKITKGNNSAKNVGGVTVFNLCTSSGHALYFNQVSWNYLEQYQSYRAETISILKITKGNNSAKIVGGVNIVNLCTSFGHALYLCQLSWNYLERYQSYRADTISIRKITKGNNSAKNVGGATVVNLCMSYDHALYFYQVLWNYLIRYQSYRADLISILKITKGNNSAKNVGGVTVLYLCTSSGHALYFYQVLWNYLN